MKRNHILAHGFDVLPHFTSYMFQRFICSQSHIYLAESSVHEAFESICLDDRIA